MTCRATSTQDLPGPRTRGPYITQRKKYLATITAARCCLCGGPVNMAAPRKSPMGATIEHRIPVRKILADARSWAEVMALVCDTRHWSIAHSRCQSRQGAIAANTGRGRPRITVQPAEHHSRVW